MVQAMKEQRLALLDPFRQIIVAKQECSPFAARVPAKKA
jgi:hypothetical protein